MPSFIFSTGTSSLCPFTPLTWHLSNCLNWKTMSFLCITKPIVVLGKNKCLINVCIIGEWMDEWMHEWINSNTITRLNLRKTMRCSKEDICNRVLCQKRFYLSGWGCQGSSHRSERNEEACVRWREC